MTDERRTQTFAIVYALLLVVSAVTPFVAFAGATAAAPSGMATIPDDAVTEDVPTDQSMPLGAAELRGGVLASDHADSLEVILTTADHAPTVMNGDSAAVSGNGMALVLRDQEHSAGREIAIDSGQLQDALGYAPEAIYGTHEDGSEWTATAEYVDGYLVFDVPHFSDNTVTFSGTVDVSLAQATDATTAQWGLSNYDSASNVSVDVTGVANTETDTVAKTLTSGTINADIVGDRAPPSTTLTIEGSGFGERSDSVSFTGVGADHSESITVDGSLSTNAIAEGATVTLTGRETAETDTVSKTLTSGAVNADIAGNQQPDPTTLTLTGNGFGERSESQSFNNVGDGHTGSITLDGSLTTDPYSNGATVTITGDERTESVSTSQNGIVGSGSISTTVAGTEPVDLTLSLTGNQRVIDYDSTSLPDFTADATNIGGSTQTRVDTIFTADSAATYTVDSSAGKDGYYKTSASFFYSVYDDSAGSWGSYTSYNKNGEFTVSLDDGDKVRIKRVADPSPNYGITIENTQLSTDKTVNSGTVSGDIDGNGFSTSVSDGNTKTVTKSVSPDGSATVSIDTTGGLGVDASVSGTETTLTRDPSVSVGATTVSYNGKLAEGETTTLSIPSTSLSTGSQSVDLSLDTVSAASPPMRTSYSVSVEEVDGALNPSVDIDQDGVSEVSHDGILSDGQTVSGTISPTRSDDTWDVSATGSPVTVSADVTERTATTDPSVTINGVTKSYNGVLGDGQTATLSFAPSELSSGSNTVSLEMPSVSSDAPALKSDYSIAWQERDGTLDPSVDIDGDSVDEVAHTGVLTDGETATGEITPSLSDDTWTVSGTGSPVAVSAEIVETTVTKTPSVELNGRSTTIHDGTLADGETVQTTLPKNQLQEGTNRLNVSVANGGVSADAPQMQVNVAASHDASDQQSVGYTASAFEESYNVSRTYADATTDATVTIPFESSRIIDVPTVEYRIDGGDWKPVDGANYRFEGTTLEVEIADAYGGELPAGATASVRATGRKIEVANGTVSVVDPTKPGSDLETQLKIDSRSSGFHINIGPTESGDRVHYAESSVYPTEDYVIIDASGDQRLYLPALKTGDTVRVKHLRTRVVAEQGDVRIDVVKPGESPELDISPGPGGSGDPVTVEYYNTESGVKYLLNSLSRSVVIDSDVAQSPAVFTDDDSDETWSILKDAAPQPSGDSSDIFRPVGQFREQSEGLLSGIPIVPIALGGVSLVGLLLFARARNEAADATAAAAASTTGSALQRGLRGLLDFVGQLVAIITRNRRASIATGIGTAIIAARVGLLDLPSGTGILIVVAGVPIASWLILRRTDAVSRRVWLASTIAATVLGLEFVAPGTVQTAITQLTSEQVAPLLLLLIGGAVFLYLRARRADASTPEEVTNVTLGITASDEEDD